jgi:hypothetical protein
MILETETIGDSRGEILAVDHQPGSSAILIPGCYNPAAISSIRPAYATVFPTSRQYEFEVMTDVD